MQSPSAILSRAEDVALDLGERANDVMSRAADRVKAQVQEVDARAMVDDTIDFVKRRPGVTLLVALSAGFLAGTMLTRARR